MCIRDRGRLIAHGGGHPAHQGGDLAACLHETEDVIDEQQHVLVGDVYKRQEHEGADDRHSQAILALFNQCIRNNHISKLQMQQAQAFALADLGQINRFNDRFVVFKPAPGVRLCRCFTTYWLFFKLIELEWQEILAPEEVAETYQFMDTVIADGEELEAMERKLLAGELLDDDSVVYLRHHWRQVRGFWHDLQQDLLLLQQGLMPYQPLMR